MNKFLQPAPISASDFVAHWRALVGPPTKLQDVVCLTDLWLDPDFIHKPPLCNEFSICSKCGNFLALTSIISPPRVMARKGGGMVWYQTPWSKHDWKPLPFPGVSDGSTTTCQRWALFVITLLSLEIIHPKPFSARVFHFRGQMGSGVSIVAMSYQVSCTLITVHLFYPVMFPLSSAMTVCVLSAEQLEDP
jgi:hypothetical protein